MSDIILSSSLRNGGTDIIDLLSNLKTVREELHRLGYGLRVFLVDDGSEDDTWRLLSRSVAEAPYLGWLHIGHHEVRQGRGNSFIDGLRTSLKEAVYRPGSYIALMDLNGKAPHDPSLLCEHVFRIQGRRPAVLFGSTRFRSFSLDNLVMRSMGALEHCSLGAKGKIFSLQSPAMQFGRAECFAVGLRNYDIYRTLWSSYTDEAWPEPGTPGLLLRLMSLAGVKIIGTVLPVIGTWRPRRSWRELRPHFRASMLHRAIAKRMFENGEFEADSNHE